METKPKFFKWALIIGIVIVLNLFFNYTISLFYKEPDYATYFPPTQIIQPITNKEECLKVGGQWSENANIIYKGVVDNPTMTAPVNNSYCDPNFTKQQEFNKAQKVYERNVFIVLVVLGIISFLFGAFIPNEIISIGLSWGGVLSFVIASIRYWSVADNLIKVLILGIALATLIWLAIKKFGNNIGDESR